MHSVCCDSQNQKQVNCDAEKEGSSALDSKGQASKARVVVRREFTVLQLDREDYRGICYVCAQK